MNNLSRFAVRGILLIILIALAIPFLSAEPVRVAMLGLENLNRDPRYDYLEGMIVGVLMYDMTRVDGIELVERARLDRVFEEQELRLTGLLQDTDTAQQVGQLAGADALIEGNYAFLGREMIINLSLLMTEDGTTVPLSVRGYTENSIHELAQSIAEELTGNPVILTGIEGERSLLSLSDEEPGSIEFYCNFEQGEIYVDEEFYGYTPGGTTPTLLEDLSPGEHRIRVEAGNDFGEVEWPEVIFKDWERTVEVKADRKSVVRATVRHFNSILYNARQIYREEWRVGDSDLPALNLREDASYQDRQGREVPVSFELDARMIDGTISMRLTVRADGEERTWEFNPNDEDIDFEEMVGPVNVDFERDKYYDQYWETDLMLERTDIYQGMHRE